MAFSNALPDCLSYYHEKINDGINKKKAIKMTTIVFLTEVISTLIIITPIIFINDTKTSILISYSFIFLILLFINYYKDKNIVESLEKMPVYFSIGFIIWVISKMAQKYFKIDI